MKDSTKEPDHLEAERIAARAGLKVFRRRGVFLVYRDTIPKLTFIGQRVNARACLSLVKAAAGSRAS